MDAHNIVFNVQVLTLMQKLQIQLWHIEANLPKINEFVSVELIRKMNREKEQNRNKQLTTETTKITKYTLTGKYNKLNKKK